MRYTGIIKSVGYRNKKSKQKIRAFHQLMQKPNILTSAECFISVFFLNKFRLWKVSIEMNCEQLSWQGTGWLCTQEWCTAHLGAHTACLLQDVPRIQHPKIPVMELILSSPCSSLPGTGDKLLGMEPPSHKTPATGSLKAGAASRGGCSAAPDVCQALPMGRPCCQSGAQE